MRNILSKKSSKSEIITAIIFLILFIIIAIICIYPLFWAFNNSLKTFEEYNNNNFAITKSWRFINYVKVFSGTFQ